MKKQQGNMLIWVIILIVIIVFALWYVMKYGYKLPQQTAQGPVMTTSDLDAASRDLDRTNLNQMDSGISQVSADSSSF